VTRGLLGLIVLASLALSGCEREERDYRPDVVTFGLEPTVPMSALEAGGGTTPAAFSNESEESAYAVSEGKRLYRWYNCNGCHGNGGGGSGPPLMDGEWIYGGGPAHVVASILHGRPNGMPAFGGKVPYHQALQIAAYVRSMSGILPKDVAPGRADHLRAKKPESATEQLPPEASAVSPSGGAIR
jgi:cytochrome c oxidase cbb3-type subunit 3